MEGRRIMKMMERWIKRWKMQEECKGHSEVPLRTTTSFTAPCVSCSPAVMTVVLGLVYSLSSSLSFF